MLQKPLALTGFFVTFLLIACGQSAGPLVGEMLPLTVQTGSTSKIQVPLEFPRGERVRKATFSTKDDVLPEQQLNGKTLNLVVPANVSVPNNKIMGSLTVEDSNGNVTRKEFLITILKSSNASNDEFVEVAN